MSTQSSNDIEVVPSEVAVTTDNAASDIVSEEQTGALTPNASHRDRRRSRSMSRRSRSTSTIEYSDDDSSKKSGKSRKRKRSSSRSRSENDSDSDNTSSEKEDRPPKKKRTNSAAMKKFQLYKPSSKKDRNSWELPSELAHYYNKYCRVFIDEADLKEQKEGLPVPSNIREVPKVDHFVQATWDNENKHYMADKDGDLVRIQGRIRDVMGPLSKIWHNVEQYKNKEIGDEDMVIEDMAELLQKSVLLLAQASNSVTYQRRMEALKSVKENKTTASKMVKKHA